VDQKWLKEDKKMKSATVIIIMFLTLLSFGTEKMRPLESLKIVMTNDSGMPLEDGFYNVTYKIYDKSKDGNLMCEQKSTVEAKNGVCVICHELLRELEKKGYKEVWLSLKIENYKENTFRTRIFLDPSK
jgi:hypothetical protein